MIIRAMSTSEMNDPWGSVDPHLLDGPDTTATLVFDDSFNPSSSPTKQDNYVPLEDSAEYLSSLQKKLSRIEGKTSSKKMSESKQLINGLVMSRQVHSHQLVQSDSDVHDDHLTTQSTVSSTATLDPDGAVGVVLRRLAPDKVATTEEEMYRLLEADILNKIHEELNGTSSFSETALVGVHEETGQQI